MALQEIAQGVFAWIQPGGGSGISNAGVIVDDDGLTVVDTLMVRSQWEPLGEAVAALGLPLRRVVLTHAHIDHVGGTYRFRNAAIYGSPFTSEMLDQPMTIDGYKAFMPAFEEEFDDLAEIGTRPVSHEVTDNVHLTARVEVLPARGHTPGDLLVVVDDADVVFAGDLCFFGVTPLAFQGDPATWADVLDVVVEFGSIVVPGHGPVGGEAEVRDLQAYLRACVAAAGDPSRIGPGPWDRWIERERDAVNVEKAAMLADGDDGIPTSMLRMLGLI